MLISCRVALRALLPALALVAGLRAHAELSLLPPAASWVHGTPLTLEVLVRDGIAPRSIELELIDSSGGIHSLEAVGSEGASGPVRSYRSPAPALPTGTVRVRLRGDARAPYAVEFAGPPPPSLLGGKVPADAEGDEASAASPPPPLQFPWIDAFYSHEPLYLLTGIAPEVDVKFQLSFKYQLYTTEPGIPKRIADGWVAPRGLYFTYTQTSLWDILEDSSPFRDTSYKPGLYWQERDLWVRETEDDRFRLSLMAGLEHESNGRAEPFSRSINIAVIRPTLGYASPGGWRFQLSPKVYGFLEKTDNQDLDKFRGYLDLHTSVRAPSAHPAGGFQLALTGRKGTRGSRGSIQADLSHPAAFIGMPGFLTVQIFSGDGETILDYNRKYDTQFRIGFSAIR